MGGWRGSKWGLLLAALIAVVVVEVQGAFRPKFVDVSRKVGLLSREQLQLVRETRNKYFGSTVADFDKNGKYDLMLSNHAQNPELYYGKGDKTFQYSNPKLRSHDLHATASADIDNDGKLDIFINLGGGNGERVNGVPLTLRTTSSRGRFGKEVSFGLDNIPARGRSMSFLDIDCDGYLDYVLVNRRNLSATYSHLVYKNDGMGTFQFRNRTGIEQVEAAWFHVIDINNDSYMDLLLMDVKNTELWLGTGSFKFVQGSDLLPGLSTLRNARAAAEIDYDNDGDMDLVIVCGSETAQVDDVFYENLGDGRFSRMNLADVGLPLGGKHYHVTTGDLNNDGFIDMYISRMTWFEAPRLDDLVLINNGDKTFSAVKKTNTELSLKEPLSDGDNANIFDYDGDGRNDILVGSRNTSWYLFQNQTPRWSGAYLRVRIGAPRAETAVTWFRRKALGALVKVFCGEKQFMQRVGSQGQSHSQSYMDTLVFGLGSCRFVERVEIHYTGGVVVSRGNIAANQLVTIGLYNMCPAGKYGLNCNKRLKECKKEGCSSDEVCEMASLVGNKCVEELLSRSKDILENGKINIYNSTWVRLGKAEYTRDDFYEGGQAMRLPIRYSEVQQTVTLPAMTNHKLSCKVSSGPIVFRMSHGTSTVKESINVQEEIPGGPWSLKEMEFETTTGGLYTVGLRTDAGVKGVVDDCSLRHNLLFNGDMESGRYWLRNDYVRFVKGAGFGETRAMKLSAPFSQARQKVTLKADESYRLSCKTRGKVAYRIYFGRSIRFKKYNGPDEYIKNTKWARTMLEFKVVDDGDYDIRILTPSGVAGFADDCDLLNLSPSEMTSIEGLDCLSYGCPV